MNSTETSQTKGLQSKHTPIFWAIALFLFVGLLFARVAKPEWLWLTIVLAVGLLSVLVGIVYVNRQDIQREKAIRSAGSLTTVVLVICIIGVVNFIASRYPQKIDFTKNKINTLSDQTIKTIRGIKEPLKFTLFSKPEQTDEFRPLFDNLKTASSRVDVEFVNPLKESIRAQKAGLHSEAPTLQLSLGTREQLIETPTEEKLTNALIKLSKSQSPLLCNITQHGEKDFESADPMGYSSAKAVLEKQSYKVKAVNLVTEGKIPTDCTGISILGPTKAYFPQEMAIIRTYLDHGGKAIIAVDFTVKGVSPETSPEFVSLLADWGVNMERALIIDPVSKAFQLDPTMPIVATYSKEHSITKEMQGNTLFPFARPITILKNLGPDVKINWLTQTTPNSWGESDLKGLVGGTAAFGTGDFRGPLTVSVAIDGKRKPAEGKPSEEAKDARIIVLGTSFIGSNQFARFGNNLDFFANATSWALDDEGMISIRKKEDVGGQIELSQKAAGIIFLVSVFLIPFLLIVCGIAIWWYRKKL